MTKSVPDPPTLDLSDVEDALMHLSTCLDSAFETNTQVCERADIALGDLAWATRLSLEKCQALTATLIEGVKRA